MDDDYEMFKIVIIGSTGTGKTNIATRYIRNEFNENQKATVGVEFLSKIVQVRNQNIKVTLWDTAGQERYKSLSKVYYKGASGVLIVYDVTEPQSYLDVEAWMRLASTSGAMQTRTSTSTRSCSWSWATRSIWRTSDACPQKDPSSSIRTSSISTAGRSPPRPATTSARSSQNCSRVTGLPCRDLREEYRDQV